MLAPVHWSEIDRTMWGGCVKLVPNQKNFLRLEIKCANSNKKVSKLLQVI